LTFGRIMKIQKSEVQFLENWFLKLVFENTEILKIK